MSRPPPTGYGYAPPAGPPPGVPMYQQPPGPPPGVPGTIYAQPNAPNSNVIHQHLYAQPPGPPPGFMQPPPRISHSPHPHPPVSLPVYHIPTPTPAPPHPDPDTTSTKFSDLPPAYSVLPFEDLNFEKDNIEPMLLLDTTASMHLPAAPNAEITRIELVRRSIGIIVKELGEADSQAEFEQGSDDEGGGLRTVTFAGGTAIDLGDLNPGNLDAKFQEITWEGTTLILPGYLKLLEVYNEEFGQLPTLQQPKLVCLVITDGEAVDVNDLAVQILTMDFQKIFLVFGLIGYGPDYENARVRLSELAKLNDHIRVIEMNMAVRPSDIAGACLSMVR